MRKDLLKLWQIILILFLIITLLALGILIDSRYNLNQHYLNNSGGCTSNITCNPSKCATGVYICNLTSGVLSSYCSNVVNITNCGGENNTSNNNSNGCNVKPDARGNCPVGCVNYGNPLGCVTPDYYNSCWSNGQLNSNCPVCLASNTDIATPTGYINVKDIKVGMIVWSLNKKGEKVASKVIKISNTDVPKGHRVVHLVLSDGREVWASFNHLTIAGLPIGKLKIGDSYDGSKVKSTEIIPYWDDKTYDILPDSETGFYWANGILLGSTLAPGV